MWPGSKKFFTFYTNKGSVSLWSAKLLGVRGGWCSGEVESDQNEAELLIYCSYICATEILLLFQFNKNAAGLAVLFIVYSLQSYSLSLQWYTGGKIHRSSILITACLNYLHIFHYK